MDSAYHLWLSLNKYTATEAEITAKKVESINQKLEHQRQLVNLTKKAYEDIKSLAGSFAEDTISAQSRYLETVNQYTQLLANRNFAVTEYEESERKRIEKANKAIDRQNLKEFGFTAKTVDNNDYTYVRGIIEEFRKYIDENKEAYLSVGGNYDDFIALAKKVTGYEKVENSYAEGKVGGIPDLIPYVEAEKVSFPVTPEVKLEEFDISPVTDAVDNNFKNLANGTCAVISKALSDNMQAAGEEGVKSLADGLNSGLIKYEGLLASAAEGFASKLKEEIEKSIEKEYITNNYTSNYTINSQSRSAEAELEDFERYEELKKFRKTT